MLSLCCTKYLFFIVFCTLPCTTISQSSLRHIDHIPYGDKLAVFVTSITWFLNFHLCTTAFCVYANAQKYLCVRVVKLNWKCKNKISLKNEHAWTLLTLLSTCPRLQVVAFHCRWAIGQKGPPLNWHLCSSSSQYGHLLCAVLMSVLHHCKARLIHSELPYL